MTSSAAGAERSCPVTIPQSHNNTTSTAKSMCKTSDIIPLVYFIVETSYKLSKRLDMKKICYLSSTYCWPFIFAPYNHFSVHVNILSSVLAASEIIIIWFFPLYCCACILIYFKNLFHPKICSAKIFQAEILK